MELINLDNIEEISNKIQKIKGFSEKHQYQLRVCLIGDSFVGKTSLLKQYYDKNFSDDYINTIGCDFKVVTLNVDGTIIKLQMWDTAGQERFKAISVNYYRSAHAFIFVFDLTSKASFNNIDSWLNSAYSANKQHFNRNILIGNKSDLENREVSSEDAIEYAKLHNLLYFETSALKNIMVTEAFHYIAYEITKVMISKSEHIVSTDENQSNEIKGTKLINDQESFSFEKKKKCSC